MKTMCPNSLMFSDRTFLIVRKRLSRIISGVVNRALRRKWRLNGSAATKRFSQRCSASQSEANFSGDVAFSSPLLDLYRPQRGLAMMRRRTRKEAVLRIPEKQQLATLRAATGCEDFRIVLTAGRTPVGSSTAGSSRPWIAAAGLHRSNRVWT